MNPVFLDTCGLIAVVNTDDQWHDAAELVWRQLIIDRRPLVSTSLVLIEIGDGLSRVRHRPLAVDLYDRLTRSPRIEIVHSTSELEARAWRLFRERSDKEWGVTDCASFTVMTDRGICEAFTTDHHFEQAGFISLIKED